MKKIISFIIVFFLSLSLFSGITINVSAETNGTCGENLTWTLNGSGLLTIGGSGEMYDWESEYDVPWYNNLEDIKAIIIEKGVTSIGNFAFQSCVNLTNVNISDSITDIGEYAFFFCRSLSSIDIPNSVTNIRDAAFRNCNNLTDVYYIGTEEQWDEILIGSYNECLKNATIHFQTIIASGEFGNNLTWTLNDGGKLIVSGTGYMTSWHSSFNVPWYDKRSSIKTIIIENGIKNIGALAFYDCYNLTSITIPQSVTWIGESAFSSCTRLTSIDIPDTVTSIGNNAFYNCENLASIDIPNGITAINPRTFYNCKNLTSITIPDGVTSIDESAFESCSRLTGITIPKSVTSIDIWAFSECNSLINIDVDKDNPSYASIDGNLFNKNKTTLLKYAIGKTDTSYTIPNSVTDIGSHAFDSCCSLTGINIPNGVTNIKNYAFTNCDNLISITIPDSVTSLGAGIFMSCDNLTRVSIPSSVTRIDNSVFESCISLTSIDIPGVTTIGSRAFIACRSLASINIPDTVTSIKSWAFAHCDSLTSVTVPDGITSIEERTFAYCDNLTNITIPASVTKIGSQIVYDSNKLTDIYYGGTEEQWNKISIGTGNTELKKVTIHFTIPVESITLDKRTVELSEGDETTLSAAVMPENATNKKVIWKSNNESVATVDENGKVSAKAPGTAKVTAAAGGKSVSCTVTVTAVFTETLIDSGTCGDNLTWELDIDGILTISGSGDMYDRTLSSNAPWYSNQNSIKTVVIENGVTSVGDYAFAYCDLLTHVTIPNSVTVIGGSAFAYCSSLTSVTIPDGVTGIDVSAFRGCTGLTSINISNSITSIGNYAFTYCENLTTVHYNGAESQWEKISIGTNNEFLTDATIHFALTAKITDIKVTDLSIYGLSKYIIDILASDIPENASVFVASYDKNERLLENVKLNPTNLHTTFENTNVETIRVFVWKNDTSLTPVCEAFTKSVQK